LNVVDPRFLSGLPPCLRRRIVGIGVETETLLVLGPSPDRIERLLELREDARDLADETELYNLNLTFHDVPQRRPRTWGEAAMIRLLIQE
jgi:hypothetical protein